MIVVSWLLLIERENCNALKIASENSSHLFLNHPSVWVSCPTPVYLHGSQDCFLTFHPPTGKSLRVCLEAQIV